MGYEQILSEEELFQIQYPIWSYLIEIGNTVVFFSLTTIIFFFIIRIIFLSSKIVTSKGDIDKISRYKLELKYLSLGLFLQVGLYSILIQVLEVL